MDRGLDYEDSDAFFSMRRMSWEESRDRALAEKEANEAGADPKFNDPNSEEADLVLASLERIQMRR